LGMIFRSRLARGGCAAVLSASAVPELSVEMAQLLGQRVLGFGAVCFSIFVRHYWVAGILGSRGADRRNTQTRRWRCAAPRRQLWLRMVFAKRRRGYGQAPALAMGKAGGGGDAARTAGCARHGACSQWPTHGCTAGPHLFPQRDGARGSRAATGPGGVP
jgi:hypothetical protein